MARDNRSQPQWLGGSTKRVEDIAKNFESDLKAVAIRFAKHELSERILEKHVDQAFEALSRSGLRRLKFWKRPETEVGIGSALIPLSFSVPDVVGIFVEDIETAQPWNLYIMIPMVLFGALLIAHGWLRNSL